MNDSREKLELLRSRLGLKSGSEIAPKVEKKTTKPLVAARTTRYTRPEKEEASENVLTSDLASRLKRHLGMGGLLPDSMVQSEGVGEREPLETLLPGEIMGDDAYGFFLYKRRFPLDYLVGDVPLGEGLACRGREIALSACDGRLTAFDPVKACFLDAETTGLAGGAGTVAFLVGVGYFEGDAFCLEQCFMRDYDDEPAMLEYLSKKLAAFECLVSYNGKSFDLPLLRSRFVQNRISFPLDQTAHYDLVHAARRVWKKRLNDCSLGNIEKAVLGFTRHDDVPGYLIPQLWLDYLESGNGRSMVGVFAHHAMDILSLAALSGHLSGCIAEKNGPAFHHAEDRVSLIRLYFKNREYASVAEHGEAFLAASQVADILRHECLRMMGQAYKRLGLFDDMARVWALLHQEYPEDPSSAEDLSKYHEHHARDFAAAIAVCRETLNSLESRRESAPKMTDFSVSSLRGRLARLEKKDARLRSKATGSEQADFDE